MRFSKRQNGASSARDFGEDKKIRNLVQQYKKQFQLQNIRKTLRAIDWTPYREPRFVLAASTAAAFLIVSGGYIHWNMGKAKAWDEVFTNGTYVGLVPNQKSTLGQMKRTAEGYDVDLRLAPVHQVVSPGYNWYSVTQLPESAFEVSVNGSPLVYTSSSAAAQNVLETVQQSLTPKKLNADAKVQFNGKVTVQKAIVGVASILDVQAAVNYILHPAQTFLTVSRSYNPIAAQSGALIQQTALAAGTPDATNQGGTSNSTKQDQTKLVKPLLTVKTSEVVTATVKVPFPVKKIKDSRLGVGTVKVTTKGKPGITKETVRKVYQDGKLDSSKVLTKDVVSKPKQQVEDVGTNRGIATGSWGWPVAAYDITSPYGPRILFGRYNFHPGIDIGCPVGTPVYATNDGVVEDAGWNNGGYGIWVKINNGHGIETVFGHLSKVKVHPGETVAKGQLIAYSGDTGFVTGPHLHYEVRRHGQHINPTPYM